MQKSTLRIGAAAVALIAVVWIVQAGNLEPPGPPAPTMLPLDQVEARTPLSNSSFLIPGPGSYFLTEDLTVASATGLTILVDDVTIDLNGFAIVGALSAGISGVAMSEVQNVTIKNGTIRGFDTGVDIGSSDNVRLLDVHVLENAGNGISSFDASLTIEGCTVEGNAGFGITVASDFFNLTDSLIRDSSISRNGEDGISADATLLEIRDNRVQLNGARGIQISMTNAKITGNTVDLNGGTGIRSGIASGVIQDNLVFSNGQNGVGFGIEVVFAEPGQFIARNQASGNFSGDFDLDPNASAAPVTTLDASPGAWDNVTPSL